MQALKFGEKSPTLPRHKVVNQREMRHHKFNESYVNPVLRAREYLAIMKKEDLNQSELAVKLKMSRVRVSQILAMIKLPEEQQKFILIKGKEQLITERALRQQVKLQDINIS